MRPGDLRIGRSLPRRPDFQRPPRGSRFHHAGWRSGHMGQRGNVALPLSGPRGPSNRGHDRGWRGVGPGTQGVEDDRGLRDWGQDDGAEDGGRGWSLAAAQGIRRFWCRAEDGAEMAKFMRRLMAKMSIIHVCPHCLFPFDGGKVAQAVPANFCVEGSRLRATLGP